MVTKFCHFIGHAYSATLWKIVIEEIMTWVILKGAEAEFYNACIQAKHTREPFLKEYSSPSIKAYGEQIHLDVWEKLQVKILRGKKYFTSFLDNFTDKVVIVLRSQKANALMKYKFFETWAKN